MTIVARKLNCNPFSFDSKRIVLSVRVTINAFIDVFQKVAVSLKRQAIQRVSYLHG